REPDPHAVPLREDHLLAHAAAQLPDVNPDDVAARMKARHITIVRTSIRAVLENPAATPGKQGLTGPIQRTIPGLERPIKRRERATLTATPHQTRRVFVGQRG
ncbi:hypothetical protein, partial [Actinoplanes regularis]|uniref:hypothetical protein n=1 Tax=Actinoplanes regularis TaxID=52697 RepID=UPI0025535350